MRTREIYRKALFISLLSLTSNDVHNYNFFLSIWLNYELIMIVIIIID